MRRRYRQIQDPTTGEYRLVEINNDAAIGVRSSVDLHVQMDVEPFRSIVDGSVITSRRQLAEHNRRNGVVHESEYGSAADRERFWAQKTEERNDAHRAEPKTAYGRRLREERRKDILKAIEVNGG